jgi:DNA-binding LytR/AlgR family response regulator
MKVSLICSDSNEKELYKLLESRRIIVDPNATVCLVEKGTPLPEKGVSIVFNPMQLDDLLCFFDMVGCTSCYVKGNVILAESSNRYELVKYEDIMFFKSNGNYIYCHTKTKRYEVKPKLYELENALAERGFIRVNKSCLVNLLMVSEIIPWFGEKYLLKMKNADTEIEVSRKYVKAFKTLLDI